MKAILLLFCALQVMAQPTKVTVSDTIYDPFGAAYNGSVVISLAGAVVYSTGFPVIYSVKSVSIKAGVLSTTVIPGRAYTLAFGTGVTLTCTFPASTSSVPLQPNCVNGLAEPQSWAILTSSQWATLTSSNWSTLTP